MTRKQLLEALEKILPSRHDWFISDEDEGHVVVCFSIIKWHGVHIEEEQTDE